ncbi:MAG: LPS export ABC transporter periplasmic protein LptC [Elusimicrobia bacterium]|nr:LPS export ABC transporter periplasmic protein LptC [Candidatus Liberimonas magnetica]
MRKLIFYLITVLLMVPACGSKKEIMNSTPLKKQIIEKFSISESNKGKPDWVLDAISAEIFEEQKKIFLTLPEIKFYEKGEYTSNLKAKSGRINTETYDIWGDSDCVLVTAKGEKLFTSNLHYRSDIKKIVTEENVKLIRPTEVIYGKGLEATPDLKSVIIKKQLVEMEDNK